MKNCTVEVDGKRAMGLEVELPKAPLVVVYGKEGFIMCGYLNIDAADRLGVAAARVRGVSNVDDLLKAKVESVTSAAQKKGINVGMSGREALARLF